MAMNKKFNENMSMGFDRTQLWKEYEAPMIRRQTALNAAQSFFGNNEIKYTPTELKALYMHFLNLIENGDTSFFTGVEKYLEKNNVEQELPNK